MKRCVALTVLLCLVTVFFTACNSNICPSCVEMYSSVTAMQFLELAKEYNLSTSEPNTQEQYREIQEHLNPDDMILYYDMLGRTECDKIANVLGYENLDDFMIRHDYCDENGQPSISVMRKKTEELITRKEHERQRHATNTQKTTQADESSCEALP